MFPTVHGKPHYEQERIGATASYYASPVAVDGKILIVSVNGTATVFKAGAKPEVAGRSESGERCVATLAIVDDTLNIRTSHPLRAFGQSNKTS